LILLFQALMSPALALGQHRVRAFVDIKLTPDSPVDKQVAGVLRPDAAEIAEILELEPYMQKLIAAKAVSAGGGTPQVLDRPLLKTKLFCLYRIVIAQQEVRRIAALLDRDLATANVDLGTLSAKQANFNNTMTTANFMQGGILGIVKQSLSLHGQGTASQYELMTSFGLGTTLSVINLAVPMFWTQKVDAPPNSLEYFLNLNRVPPDASESYLWKFFNKEVPGTTWHMTRRQVLLNHWHDFAGLDTGSGAGTEYNHRVLAALPAEDRHLRENFALVMKRIILLHDLKTHLEEFDASLYELHKAIEAN
jgi:hypothetical protein